ncbi:hypothetical protein DRP77_11490, partial [Candidatus Poribacteria bacterium]
MKAEIPESLREPIELIVESIKEVLGDHLRAIILKGSLVKGDFIPGYSDVDIHVLVDDEVMEGPRALRLEEALEVQRRIGKLRPQDYGVWGFQIFFLSAQNYPPDWSPPPPGGYVLLYGEIPEGMEETIEEQLRKARFSLIRIPGYISYLLERLVDKPDERLVEVVRLTGAILKAVLYNAASLLTGDPPSVWRMPVWDVLSRWGDELCPEGHLRGFFEGV